jgi:hypothetical protein
MSALATSAYERTSTDFELSASVENGSVRVSASGYGRLFDNHPGGFRSWEFYRRVGGEEPYGKFERLIKSSDPNQDLVVDTSPVAGQKNHYRAMLVFKVVNQDSAPTYYRSNAETLAFSLPAGTEHICDARCGAQLDDGCYCDEECSTYADCCNHDASRKVSTCSGSTCDLCQ